MIINKPVNKRFVFTLFFMDHMLDKTGVSRFMLGQQKMFLSHEISYVSAFIIRRAYFNGRIEAFNEYGLLVDGEYQGVFSEPELTEELMRWNGSGIVLLDFHIHHFLHVKLKDIDHFLRSFPELSVKIYLHDYYTLCRNYTLMKNDEQYCGGKGLTPQICNDCRYYHSSVKYTEELFDLLNIYKDRLLFVSPSEITKDIFLNFHPEYADKTVVIPHLKLTGNSTNIEPVKEDEPVKIAFLGYRNPMKGWDLWESITAKYKNDPGYSFYIFNSDDLVYKDMIKVPVRFTEDRMDAMTKALIENGIHAVFLWSLWPETYSYTFFESYSANCFVITGRESGNIAAAVQKYGNGRTFVSFSEFDAFLTNSKVLKQEINRFRLSGNPGPESISDNDEILGPYLDHKGSKQETAAIPCRKTNPVLMWVLNRHYDKKYRIQ